MITVGKLKALLANIPDTARVHAYEGGGAGLRIVPGEGDYWCPSVAWWIEASQSETEDADSLHHIPAVKSDD